MEETPGSALMELSPSHELLVKFLDQQVQELVDLIKDKANQNGHFDRDLYAVRYRLATLCDMVRRLEVFGSEEVSGLVARLTKDSCKVLTLDGVLSGQEIQDLVSPVNVACQAFGYNSRETRPYWEIMMLALRTCVDRLVQLYRKNISDQKDFEQHHEHEPFSALSTAHCILSLVEIYQTEQGWVDDDIHQLVASLTSGIEHVTIMAHGHAEIDNLRSHMISVRQLLAS